MSRWCAMVLISLIRGYQYWMSPWLGGSCRYLPSCSHYAIEAIERFGPLKGAYFASRRIVRCHPWQEGGHDPVPGQKISS